MRAAKIIGLLAILSIGGLLVHHVLNRSTPNPSAADTTVSGLAYFEKLNEEQFKLTGQVELDTDVLFANFPENISVTFANKSFDTDTGATHIIDVKITPSDNPDIGVSIDRVRFWGVDAKAVSDRISGQRLGETLPIAQRIEADDIAVFGIETLFETMRDVTTEMAVDMVESMVPEGDRDISITDDMPFEAVDKMVFTINKMVVSDIVAHPWILNLSEQTSSDDTGKNEVWHFAQKFAAWNHALSFENYAAYDVDLQMEMSVEEIPYIMDMSYELMGYRGYHRGDTEFGLVKGSKSLTDISIPVLSEDNSDITYQPMKMESYTDYYTMENVKLSKVWNHMARGVFPARTELDLMGFGVFESGKSGSKINDIELFSTEKMFFDMSEFHWLVPEVIDFRLENMSFNIAGFIEYLETSLSITGDDPELVMTEAQKQVARESIKILEKYDLSEPVIDLAMAYHWDANSGDADFGYVVGVDDFITYDVKTDAILPDYASAIAIVPEQVRDTKKEDIAELFTQSVAFKKYALKITDKGGLEKSFAMAVDFAQLAPEDDPSMAMLRSTTPEILRNMATNAFILPMSEVGKVFPPGVNYLQSVSDFVGKGGVLSVRVAPNAPLYVKEAEALMLTLQSNPEGIEEALGIQVTHTPPH